MVKKFLYTELYLIYRKESTAVGVYMWMHEYCRRFLNEQIEFSKVTLTLDGTSHSPEMKNKIYEFDRNPADVKLQVNRD